MSKIKKYSFSWFVKNVTSGISHSPPWGGFLYNTFFYGCFDEKLKKLTWYNACRELATSNARSYQKFHQQNKKKTTIDLIISWKPKGKKEAINKIANMFWGLYRLEKKLGFSTHSRKYLTLSENKRTSSAHLVVRVTADPRWHYSKAMFSMFLGELRRYYKTKSQQRFITRGLLYQLLLRHDVKEIFGNSPPKIRWGYTPYNGRTTFEHLLRYKYGSWGTKRKELGGFVFREQRNMWQYKPPKLKRAS